jgi:molybdenum cofactor cytidylyltransferase
LATGAEDFAARDLQAIVLAAGSATRFGGGKLTAPFAGRTLIEVAVDTALTAPVRAVTVVVGADARVAEVLAGRPVRIVEAPDHTLGLAHSLCAGIASLPADAEGVFIFLGDMPRIPPTILPRLAAALAGDVQAVTPLCGGRRGHPVLFRRDLFETLRALEGDTGAGGLLGGLGERLMLIPTEDDGVLRDVDSPDQLAALANRPTRR